MKEDKYWSDKWNKLHIKYIAEEMENAIEGISECGMFRTFEAQPHLVGHRNEKMADWLEKILNSAKTSYYTGEALMSDYQYDKFENYLKKLRPDSKILEKVGYDV